MSDQTQERQDILQQAHNAAWFGLWEKAADGYQQAFAVDPGQSRKAIFAAHSFLELGNLAAAQKYYEIAARLSPEDPVPVEKIGFIHEQQGNIPESIQTFEKSAELYLKNDNALRAAACLQHILLLDPDHSAAQKKLVSISHGISLNLSDLTRLVEEPQTRTFSEPFTTEEKSQNPLQKAQETALTNLASLYFELAGSTRGKQTGIDSQNGSSRMAVRNISDDPDSLNLLIHLTRVVEYFARGLNDWCLSELQSLLRTGINNPAVHFLAGSLLSDNRVNQALTHLKQTRSFPDYALSSFLLIGKIYYAQGNFSEAAASYLQALAVADTSAISQESLNKRPGIFKPLIQSYSRETNITFLKNLCETIEQEINCPDWYDRLAALHTQLSTGQQAGDTMLAEVLAAGGSPLVQRFAEVKELEDENCADSAMEEIFYMIEDGPVLLPAQLLIAENLGKQGQTEEAVYKLQLSAKLYILRGQTDQAIQTLEMAIRLSPTNIPNRTKLIELYKRQNRMGLAVDHLRKLAEIEYQMAEPDNAHQLLEDAVKQMPASKSGKEYSAALLHQNADLYMQDLQYQQASQIYQQIIEIIPDDIFANVHLAALYDKFGDRDTARQMVKNFVIHLKENQKIDQIEPFLKAMIAEIPDELEIRKQLAEWYHKLGSRVQSIEQLDIIAVQLIKKGKNEAAIVVLKTIIALNPADSGKYRQLIAYLSGKK